MHGATKESINMTLLSSLKKETKKAPKATMLPDGTNNYFTFFNSMSSNSEATFIHKNQHFSPKGSSSTFSDENLSDRTSTVKKRTKSKINYGQKKKSKIKDDIQSTDEDKNIDNDLFALVKSIEPNPNLDSDSSRDTIILDDLDSNKISPFQIKKEPIEDLTSFQGTASLSTDVFNAPNKLSVKNTPTALLSSTLDSVDASKYQAIETNPTSKYMIERKPRKTLLVPFMYDSTIPMSNILHQKSNSTLSCNSEKAHESNTQAIYAEMGLDEDLCDVKTTNFDSNLNQNPSGKLHGTNKPLSSLATPIKKENVFVPIQIKKERVSPEPQGSFVSNDIHVSMTFEADPYDMDDDLPLSFLKFRSTIEQSSPEVNLQNKTCHGYAPVFIKKELIDEDEIAFGTDCSTDLKNKGMHNISSVGKNTSEVNVGASKCDDLSSKFLQLPVRIKTEPNIEDSSKTVQNSSSSDNLNCFTTSEPVKNLTKKGSKRQSKSSKGKKKSPPKKTGLQFQTCFPTGDKNSADNSGEALHETDTKSKSSNSNLSDSSKINTVPKLSISLKKHLVVCDSPDLDFKISDEPSKTIAQTDENSLKYSMSPETVGNSTINKKSKAKKKMKQNKTGVEINLNTSSEVVPDATEFQRSDNKQIDIASSVDGSPAIKKKKSEQSTDLDENVPLTLLIKKQTGSSKNELESFLCTSVNKPVVPNKQTIYDNFSPTSNFESSSSSTDSGENFELAQIKDFLRKSGVDSSELETLGLQAEASEKKNSSKKKPSKKKDEVNVDEVLNVEPSTATESGIQKNEQINSDTEVATTGVRTQSSKKHPEKNEDTVVLMSFEEQDSLSDEASKDYLKNIISVKKEYNVDVPCDAVHISSEKIMDPSAILINIKKEPDFDSYEQSQVNAPCKDNDVPSEISLEKSLSNRVANETVNQRVTESASEDQMKITPKTTPTKKKKRRARSNTWYKKKKVRKITETNSSNVSSTSETISELDINMHNSTDIADENLNSNTEENNTVLELNINSKLISQMKNPIVVVKNFNLDVQKAATQINKKQEECTKKQNLTPDTDDTVISQSKETNKHQISEEHAKLSPESEKIVFNETEDLLANKGTAQKAKVSSSRKGKRRRKGTKRSKTKRAPAGRMQDKNLTVIPSESDTCVIDNASGIDSSVDNAVSEPNSFEKSLTVDVNLKYVEESNSEKTACLNIQSAKNAEVITIEDSPINLPLGSSIRQGRRLLSPTLNVASLEKEIEGLETYAISKGFTIPSLHEKNKNPHVLENTFDKSDDCSILSSSFIQVKKEKDSEYNYLTSSVANFPCNFSKNASEINKINSLSNISTTQILNAKKHIHDVSINPEGKTICDLNSSKEVQNDVTKSSASNLCKTTKHFRAETADNNEVALSIKKEACNMTGKLNSLPSLTGIKNMNDWIEKSSIISKPLIGISSTLTNSISKNLAYKPESKNISTNNESEDEIQVIEAIDPKTKDVPCVDLTDDNVPSTTVENNEDKSDSHLIKSNSCVLSSGNNQVKENIFNLEMNKDSSQFNYESEDLLAHIMDEDVASSNERETINLATLREKYGNEYLRYPYPPSVLFSFKPRNNKMYSRMTSQTLNLSFETVESRLKTSDNIKNQFGNKLGDIVKLEKYPISSSEVGCYHRILGVAPSHKLLSKCYKSAEKITTTDVLNLYKSAENAENSTSHPDASYFMNSTLMDIIQAVAQNSMLSNNFNFHEGTKKSSLDCVSTDNKDSFELPNANNRLTSIQPHDANNMSALPVGNVDQVSMYLGENANNKFTDYPEKSNLQTSNENDSVDTDSNFISLETRNLKQSHIDNSQIVPSVEPELPANEVLNNGVKNSSEIEAMETKTIPTSEYVEKLPLNAQCTSLTNELNSTPDLVISTNEHTDTTHTEVTPIFDIDVAILRKIVEVAGNLPSDAPITESNLWKNKATFEYNHTQSVPVMQNDESSDTLNPHDESHSSETPSVNTSEKNSKHQDSDEDDGYVDNEPVNDESEIDNHHVDLTEKDEDEPKVPQYKSKWEKIMERKALENKEKKQVNEHLLKDCFPVSSKVPSKKMNECKESDKPNKKLEKLKKKKKSIDIPSKHDSQSKSANNKQPNEMSKSKKEKEFKHETKAKIHNKGSKCKKKVSIVSESDELFAPDKPIKKSIDKKSIGINKSGDDKDSKTKSTDKNQKKFYGNRITNRGSFLTQTSDYLKNIKIPKKKDIPVSKKNTNARSEEYHSLVNLPDIDFHDKYESKYKISNRYSENSYNKRNMMHKIKVSARSNVSYSSPHLENKRMSPPRNFQTYEDNSYGKHDSYQAHHRKEYAESGLINQNEKDNYKKAPLLKTPFLLKAPSFDPMPKRHVPSNSSALMYHNDEMMHTGDNCHVNTHHSSFNPQKDNYPCEQSPASVSHSSISDFSAVDAYSSERNTLAFLQNIIQSVQANTSSPTLNSSNLPFSDKLDYSRKLNVQSPFNFNFNELTNFKAPSAVSINPSSSSVFSTFGVQNPLLEQSPTNFSQERQNHPFVSPISMDPTFSVSVSLNKNCPLPTKATSTCLVPKHLKALVGHQAIETSDVQLLMLEWSVDWLVQQQKCHDPPPISSSLKKVVSSYDSFEDHYNTYFPLMLLDTWHRIYVSWTHLSQASPYYCDISSYSVKVSHVSVECQTVFNTSMHPKGIFPDEGSILMIKYGTKSKEFAIKILGYVTHVKTRRFNPVTDSRLGSYKPPKDGNLEALQVLTLSFMGAYNSEDIDKHLPVRIHVLCNVKATLKQNDALLYIQKSPLLNSILNPIEGGLISVALTPRNSSQENVSDCVRSITKGILSPHPLPLLTIVRAVPESDRLNIIPLIIEKMKTVYKTKVLLCVRTVRALGDIAANICLHESLKLVIVNKRGDTSPQFQKYLLDELVAAQRASADVSKETLYAKNEAINRTKKEIFQNCDVILSLIRNCHDEFMETTFVENENVAQMCCIVDEANLCTEPETLIPILHGISKLILIGDPDYPAKVLSKTASSYDYNRSFFHRAYDLDLITE